MSSTVLLVLTLMSFGSAAAGGPPGPKPTPTDVPAPIVGINSVSPLSGPTQGGFTITVTGVGFAPGQTSVRLCEIDIPPAQVQVNGAGNVLTFTAPPCAAGQTQLVVSTPTGSASTVYDYESEDTLPVTGGRGWIAGAALSVAGLLVLLLTRRRSPRRA
ncbi:hypothetical protein Ais01nite_00890 [Asanoa ishikariensis]|uniref:IPT/TIG domain-containing protein n=1 Tax=Asanoa ishikariensis TaxID=137265 RepID=A0A1H3TPW6_9ACTN|nr:IPT/TIG domain-containing protein [Asanoa ishikariensis]GIF62054.1 hypothetical protein Ais01nite_00890 [Asanoa ishikariensis]SDZ51958.1 IPT/TIG domain-containing protein [Asanoa ishikariensis]